MSIYGISTAAFTATATSIKQAKPADDGFSFFDTIIDTINPLQHLPVVGNIYRSLTGDTQNGVSNVVGSTLFGGPIGGAIALASEAFKAVTASGDEPSKTALAASGTSGQTLAAASGVSSGDAAGKPAATTKDWIYGRTAAYQTAQNLVTEQRDIRATTKEWLTA